MYNQNHHQQNKYLGNKKVTNPNHQEISKAKKNLSIRYFSSEKLNDIDNPYKNVTTINQPNHHSSLQNNTSGENMMKCQEDLVNTKHKESASIDGHDSSIHILTERKMKDEVLSKIILQKSLLKNSVLNMQNTVFFNNIALHKINLNMVKNFIFLILFVIFFCLINYIEISVKNRFKRN